MNQEEKLKKAKARVEELRSFYMHLVVYIVVNLFLFLMNALTSPGKWWFYWPLFGWGIGLVVHGFTVFAGGRILGREWEERKIREIMEKDEPKG
ncbi:histidine kinase [candidate division TA06 bacterium DG_26]|uniref:Histidine kinase n=1 Tax=candidate division TA06 bacterium DG_26 TaxID=1703771 RepID=A0A0S7WE59_UNCT6|nr:MAG: histidine kinase [candidate division TA06 bacterium DG_26]